MLTNYFTYVLFFKKNVIYMRAVRKIRSSRRSRHEERLNPKSSNTGV